MLHRMCLVVLFFQLVNVRSQETVGNFQKVFAWKQLTYDVNNDTELTARYGGGGRAPSYSNSPVVFDNNSDVERNWEKGPGSTSTEKPQDDANTFFTQYNNVPMGVEKVGERLFIAVPRRRYGIPSTLNYVDLAQNKGTLSPALRPYPDLQRSKGLTSVYRTRADQCNRLWMVDTGLMEIPGNPQQRQPPAIVVFDLKTDTQLFRYQLKSSDLPSATTPTGLASITLDIEDCDDAYAYLPDLTTNGIVVYSLKQNDSWRLTHNYMHFNPTAGDLRVAGISFQWSDGIFSIALAEAADGCKTAYFHPLISTYEFTVSTCVLKNRTASADSDYWRSYTLIGDRGVDSQATMHDYHPASKVLFFADIGRDAVSCWNTKRKLTPTNVPILARDSQRLIYPSDLHVTGDEVWVMTNSLPIFGYSTYDTDVYNFRVYKGSVKDLIKGTACE